MKKDIKNFIDNLDKNAVAVFNEAEELLPMLAIAHRGYGKNDFITGMSIIPPNKINERRDIVREMGANFAKIAPNMREIECVAFASEAWTSKKEAKDYPDPSKIPPPSQDPDREEVIVVSWLDKKGSGGVITYPLMQTLDSRGKMRKSVNISKRVRILTKPADKLTENSILMEFWNAHRGKIKTTGKIGGKDVSFISSIKKDDTRTNFITPA